jgi:hypothetical protein
MFGLNLRVVTKDGETNVPVTPKVSVEFERQFQTGIGRAFQESKVEHIYWLAWKASGAKGDFESWLDELIDVEMVEGKDRPLSGSQRRGS